MNAVSSMLSWPARPRPLRSSRSACGRCCRSRSPSCASSFAATKHLWRAPADRLGVRSRPVRRRPQLDRDRLHLPGGDAGLARLGRGRPAVALPRHLSGARGRARLAFGRDDRVGAGRSCSAAPGRSPNGCAATMFTGFPWNPAGGASLRRRPLITHQRADRHLRPVGAGRPARRRGLAGISQASGCRWWSSSALPPCYGCCRLAECPGRPADGQERPHRPAQHRPAGQMAAGLRRAGRAASRRAVEPPSGDSRGCCSGLRPRSPSRSRMPAQAIRRSDGRRSSARARHARSGPATVC